MEGSKSIIIIGAGVGGISFAIALKRKFGASFDDFTIYEKASDIGGTWRDNIYPGCYSDVAIDFFSLSTDLSPAWPENFGSQPVIQAYWQKLVDKYRLRENIVFDTEVVSTEWIAQEQHWSVQYKYKSTPEQSAHDFDSGKDLSGMADSIPRVETVAARVIVSAVGVLEVPKYPDIPGLADFEGTVFHSARWQAGTVLAGKRVGVVGNGASAMQFVPIISKDPTTEVVQFARSPMWIFPRVVAPVSALSKWMKASLPLYARFVRFKQFVMHECLWLMFSFSFVQNIARSMATKYMLKNSPDVYHRDIIPSYGVGCKRVLFDTGYLSSLHRPNFTLKYDAIERIEDNGIITKEGRIPLDIIILATGFVTNSLHFTIKGVNGQTLDEYYASCGGPQAYLGTTVPGFPNLFLLAGPNTATGHTSVIFTEEVQTNYTTQVISRILSREISSVDVKVEATNRYNASIQAQLRTSVWEGCASWYRLDGGKGRNASLFPGLGIRFWWMLRKPVWGDYEVVVGESGGGFIGGGLGGWRGMGRWVYLVVPGVVLAFGMFLFGKRVAA